MNSSTAPLPATPLQTVGPYFGMALTPDHGSRLVSEDHPDAMFLSGQLTDGDGNPVKQGMIEIWQADPEGTYPSHLLPAADLFPGFGSSHASDDGRYEFVTLKPGRLPSPEGGSQAPHISIAVHGLGILKPLRSRIYFSDETEANSEDRVLMSVDETRRPLLIALVDGQKALFNISLQGDRETPFFRV
jgi:protocatechuate 3,4-dioxygenase alpha subunit